MCTFVYWKRKEGPSSQWPLHSPCSRPARCAHRGLPALQVGAFTPVLSLSCRGGVDSGRASSSVWLVSPPAPHTHTLSAADHTPWAPRPACLSLCFPVQGQERPQVSSPDPLPSSPGNNHPPQQQGQLDFCQVPCFQELEPQSVLSSD